MKAPFQTTQGFYIQNPELPDTQDAWVVGFPFGQPLTATFGLIVGKLVFLAGDAKVVMSISGIATNIPIAPGSSGSPILDIDGDVVSMAIALNQNIPAGFGMGIDKANFISELNQLINIQTSLNK
jgi:S1-C subfamily serine protease